MSSRYKILDEHGNIVDIILIDPVSFSDFQAESGLNIALADENDRVPSVEIDDPFEDVLKPFTSTTVLGLKKEMENRLQILIEQLKAV